MSEDFLITTLEVPKHYTKQQKQTLIDAVVRTFGDVIASPSQRRKARLSFVRVSQNEHDAFFGHPPFDIPSLASLAQTIDAALQQREQAIENDRRIEARKFHEKFTAGTYTKPVDFSAPGCEADILRTFDRANKGGAL